MLCMTRPHRTVLYTCGQNQESLLTINSCNTAHMLAGMPRCRLGGRSHGLSDYETQDKVGPKCEACTFAAGVCVWGERKYMLRERIRLDSGEHPGRCIEM